MENSRLLCAGKGGEGGKNVKSDRRVEFHLRIQLWEGQWNSPVKWGQLFKGAFNRGAAIVQWNAVQVPYV